MSDFMNVIVEGDLLATFVNLFELVLVLDIFTMAVTVLRSAVRSVK